MWVGTSIKYTRFYSQNIWFDNLLQVPSQPLVDEIPVFQFLPDMQQRMQQKQWVATTYSILKYLFQMPSNNIFHAQTTR